MEPGDELICIEDHHPNKLGDRFYYIAHYKNHESLYLSSHIRTSTVPAMVYHQSFCEYLEKRDNLREDRINQILN